MIEFSGDRDYSGRSYLLKRMLITTLEGAIVIFLLLGVPSLLAWIYFEIWFFFVMSLFVIIIMFVLTRESLKDACPTRIVIDINANEIYGEYRKGAATRSFDDIKTVIDMGTFYHILFYFPNQWANCICQKDLIIDGTIEEFEKLFEDKIVRKYKTKNQ